MSKPTDDLMPLAEELLMAGDLILAMELPWAREVLEDAAIEIAGYRSHLMTRVIEEFNAAFFVGGARESAISTDEQSADSPTVVSRCTRTSPPADGQP
jgi:hypothetical protein